MSKNIKTLVLILLVIILGTIAYISTREPSTSVGGPLRNFALSDTSLVSKFIISDTEGNKIVISRENSEKVWMIDGTEFKAKPENAILVLDALKRTVIKQDLDEEKIETTLKFLAVRHKKFEVFLNNEKEPSKTWYIGNGTPDHKGTFMLLQNGKQKSSIPFITYKPGMRGMLDARFFTSFNDWRYSGIYNYKPGAIRTIEFTNNDEPQESFSINVDKESQVEFLDENKKLIPLFDTAQISHYVTHFKKLHFSHTVSDFTPEQIDSVLAQKPNVTIEVTDKENSKKKVSIWKIFEETEMEVGEIIQKLNPGYAFLSINGSKELVRVQYHQWDNVLKPKSYFLPRTQK